MQRSTRFKFICPDLDGFPTRMPVYGTDASHAGSGVCNAAAHAGLIGYADAGTVVIQVREQPPGFYKGSTRSDARGELGFTVRSSDCDRLCAGDSAAFVLVTGA